MKVLGSALARMPAARIADAIQQVVLSFSGGKSSDDTGTLVLAVPSSRHQTGG